MNREERFARNEVLFREVNERIDQVKAEQDERTEFLCECGREECAEPIALTSAEYDALRTDPTTFAVIPGHEIDEIEDVVHTSERFSIVRKHGDESAVARKTDPRSR